MFDFDVLNHSCYLGLSGTWGSGTFVPSLSSTNISVHFVHEEVKYVEMCSYIIFVWCMKCSDGLI